jgi:KaiC/GvpD/RAD55 family RecA-like ATPase
MSVRDLSNDEILDHLKSNTIFRNQQLSILIKLLNSIKDSTTLAIDGSWGSGKTVFVKQLCMLADENVNDYGRNTLDEDAIKKLRTDQKIFYFNAWEQDYIGDAVSALLLKLIADNDPSLQLESMKRAANMINLSAGIKNLTHDFINIEAQTSQEKLVTEVKKLVNRHEAISRFIDDLRGDKKRLIFIIDELDRCKPTFAIDLLEVIKHYFNRDDVTFIIATNMRELSHTVQKYYGYNFDGYAYLNKFVDYAISLKKVDTHDYAQKILDWNLNYGGDEAAENVIKYLNFEMREINAYYSALKLITNFVRKDNNWNHSQYPIQLIFVPFALGLKLRGYDDYNKFVAGEGAELLSEFLEKTETRLDLADGSAVNSETTQSQQKKAAIDNLVSQYQQLITQTDVKHGRENLKDFNDAISLIGSYTTIIDEIQE